MDVNSDGGQPGTAARDDRWTADSQGQRRETTGGRRTARDSGERRQVVGGQPLTAARDNRWSADSQGQRRETTGGRRTARDSGERRQVNGTPTEYHDRHNDDGVD